MADTKTSEFAFKIKLNWKQSHIKKKKKKSKKLLWLTNPRRLYHQSVDLSSHLKEERENKFNQELASMNKNRNENRLLPSSFPSEKHESKLKIAIRNSRVRIWSLNRTDFQFVLIVVTPKKKNEKTTDIWKQESSGTK